MFSYFRGSSRTSRSSTSSIKENMSNNCPSPSTLSADTLKVHLTQANININRSPLNNKQTNFRSKSLDTVLPSAKKQQISKNQLKARHVGEKDWSREELTFIKGKKCVKCGYKSAKVSKTGFKRIL